MVKIESNNTKNFDKIDYLFASIFLSK